MWYTVHTMNIFNNICKILLTALIGMPILGALGIFPAPTADMYQNQTAYDFIKIMMDSGYIMYINSIVFIISIVLLWTKRSALAALLILPITVNIVGFHAFLDGGLLTGGAVMGNILLLLNIYFLWINKSTYAVLFAKNK